MGRVRLPRPAFTPVQEMPMSSSGMQAKAAAQAEIAQGARREHIPAVIKAGLEILGIIVGVALLWSGIAWAIPQLGLFGVAWTAGVVLILAANARRLLVRRRE